MRKVEILLFMLLAVFTLNAQQTEFTEEALQDVFIDLEGNEVIFASVLEKHKGKKVNDVLEKEPGYFSWILNADFPLYTKKVLTQIKEKTFTNKKESTLEDLQNKFNQKF